MFPDSTIFVRINIEKINFNYFLKAISSPSESSYQLEFTDKIENTIKENILSHECLRNQM